MKKFMIFLSLFFVVSLTGCTTFTFMFRPVLNNAEFPSDGSKYVILGRVGIRIDLTDPVLADSGGPYHELLKEAKKAYPKADDVVNVIIDAGTQTQTSTSVFSSETSVEQFVTISGVAIHYTEIK